MDINVSVPMAGTEICAKGISAVVLATQSRLSIPHPIGIKPINSKPKGMRHKDKIPNGMIQKTVMGIASKLEPIP